ncbi:RNA polymerase sigma factor [Pseudomonas tohonis]|uniref:RNA polymerase sigma factor n=1 Tax=Pseudomonas tohonis TaxID=2725477 RepID=UPI001F248DC1|nr:sigma-70 family RNA polymerase sigma factor [Pseudomonas tohonis]UXY51900.1 sigma-70 family RNA polymerase sigma factor [Pseudomonas tohonis]
MIMASNLDASLEQGTQRTLLWKFLIDHEPLMRKRCQQLTRNPQDAEDALSELRLRLFTLLLREPGRLDGIDNVPAWLRRVASNHCIDRLRSTPLTCNLDWLDQQLHDNAAWQPHQLGPERQACLQEAVEVLDKALNRLPPNLGQALEQHCICGVEYVELAGLLQVSEPNLRKRVQLARRQLRDWLGALCEAGNEG